MLKFAILILATTLTSSANPVAIYDPPHTMVAENVLIGVTQNGAVVSGRYRFRATPTALEFWGDHKHPFRLLLPVPIPASLKGYDDVESLVHPFITIKGAKYYPEKRMAYLEVPSLPQEAKLAVFDFWIIRDDLEKEFEALIQYDQPIIEVDRKEMVFYVPFLPNYEKYEKEMGLRRDSFLISFESYGGTTLLLAHQVTQTERSKPTLISVRPRHREIIAVERKPPNQAPEPTPTAVTPPAGQEARQP